MRCSIQLSYRAVFALTGCKDTQVLWLTNSIQNNLMQIRNPHRLAQVRVNSILVQLPMRILQAPLTWTGLGAPPHLPCVSWLDVLARSNDLFHQNDWFPPESSPCVFRIVLFLLQNWEEPLFCIRYYILWAEAHSIQGLRYPSEILGFTLIGSS